MRRKKDERKFKVCYVYDTETCNIKKDNENLAYTILFIFNDITKTSISKYEADECDEIKYFRYEKEALDYIDNCLEFGKDNDIIPVIAAYNLMFDLQPIFANLHDKYKISVNAQSGTSAYTVDLLDDDGDILLRFWDTFYLDPRGLAKMGEAAGLEKACGDWDYEKIRTPETKLTEEELYYAKRDVQVIPAYLRFILESEDYIDEEDLGSSLLTKTSIVRLFSKRVIGELKAGKKTVKEEMIAQCVRENAKTYTQYGMRKASFRGGLTFTSSRYASKTIKNVASLDVASMHHAFINGRYLPEHFELVENRINAHKILNDIRKKDVYDVLHCYNLPFTHAFHACIKFENLRIKAGTVFEKEGIGLLSEAKVYKNGIQETFEDYRNYLAEVDVRAQGYEDKVLDEEISYSKIESAKIAYIWCNEIEFWNICQVYDFDSFEWCRGEITTKFCLPPDYVSLASNILYEKKSAMKKLVNNYIDNVPYDKEISDLVPEQIRKRAYEGTTTKEELAQYYQVIIKGMYNAIYGSQAQNVNKPQYKVTDETHDIEIDDETRKNINTFEANNSTYVNYIYGSRIVAGSRMHLIIAMILLKDKFNDKIHIAGGDTDSLKIGTDESVSDNMLMSALDPLHDAIRRAINQTQVRIRKNYPKYSSNLEGLGEFEIENAGDRYIASRDYWNKCRIAIDKKGKFHITCAGVSRPANRYNLEKIANRMYELGYDYNEIFDLLIGYNTTYAPSVSFLLGHHKPGYNDMVDIDIVDYTGSKSHVKAHQSIALYPIAKTVGDEIAQTNYANIVKQKTLGYEIDARQKFITQDDKNVKIYEILGINSYTLMEDIQK